VVFKAFLIAALALSVPSMAQRVQGHMSGGYGVTSGSGFTYASSQIGLGAEVLIARGLGVAADVTAVTDDYQTIGIGSLKGICRIMRKAKTDAWVSGGFSSASVESGISDRGFNIGVGVDWWRWPRLGVRLEPRYFGFNPQSRPVHIFGVRLGLVFGGGKERTL
jgi:hypothetical protein